MTGGHRGSFLFGKASWIKQYCLTSAQVKKKCKSSCVLRKNTNPAAEQKQCIQIRKHKVAIMCPWPLKTIKIDSQCSSKHPNTLKQFSFKPEKKGYIKNIFRRRLHVLKVTFFFSCWLLSAWRERQCTESNFFLYNISVTEESKRAEKKCVGRKWGANPQDLHGFNKTEDFLWPLTWSVSRWSCAAMM